MHFTFASPYLLALLLLLPCFLWCKQSSKLYYFPKLEWITRQNPLFYWEPWLKIVLFTLMVLALAKPFVYDTFPNQHKKGRDLVLAIDASGSMGQSGFDEKNKFKNKFEINIMMAKDFIRKRHDDNMGVVLFGTFAYTASPLTYDLASLSYLLAMTNVGLAGENTAIGDALMQGMRTLSYGDAKHKAIILLTDGYHNAGQNSPKIAVEEAQKRGIKIYTIGIGKKSNYDAGLLEAIAQKSGAKSYAASSAAELSKVYADIDALEPSPIRSENYLNQKLLIFYPLIFALLLFLLWIWHERRFG